MTLSHKKKWAIFALVATLVLVLVVSLVAATSAGGGEDKDDSLAAVDSIDGWTLVLFGERESVLWDIVGEFQEYLNTTQNEYTACRETTGEYDEAAYIGTVHSLVKNDALRGIISGFVKSKKTEEGLGDLTEDETTLLSYMFSAGTAKHAALEAGRTHDVAQEEEEEIENIGSISSFFEDSVVSVDYVDKKSSLQKLLNKFLGDTDNKKNICASTPCLPSCKEPLGEHRLAFLRSSKTSLQLKNVKELKIDPFSLLRKVGFGGSLRFGLRSFVENKIFTSDTKATNAKQPPVSNDQSVSINLSTPEQYLYTFGGYEGDFVVESVHRYVPSEDTWSSVGTTDVYTPRDYFNLGVFESGGSQQVYIMGGNKIDDYEEEVNISDYDVYSPATTEAKWQNIAADNGTSPFDNDRSQLTVGVVTEADEKQYMYAVGGSLRTDGGEAVGDGLTDIYTASDYVGKYDPSVNTWTTLTSMSQARYYLAVGVVTEADGKQYLYAVGGLDENKVYLSLVEKYDPSANAWTTVASMSVGRSDLAVGVVTEADGKQYLYAVGGSTGGTALSLVEKYDPSADAWTTVASMSQARFWLAVGVLTEKDGKQYLYAAGGSTGGNVLDIVEKYDPSADFWKTVESMPAACRRLQIGVLSS